MYFCLQFEVSPQNLCAGSLTPSIAIWGSRGLLKALSSWASFHEGFGVTIGLPSLP